MKKDKSSNKNLIVFALYFLNGFFQRKVRNKIFPSHSVYLIIRYRGYRNSPDDDERYERSLLYWHILTARFAFVVVFEVSTQSQFFFCIKKAGEIHVCKFCTPPLNNLQRSLSPRKRTWLTEI